MQVKDLMNPSAVTVEPASSAALAARLIRRHNVGAFSFTHLTLPTTPYV